MPLVSVIVPNYNHERYLPLRLKSVFDQTFDDYEVILLDDCSTDNSRAVMEQHRQHSKVSKVIFNAVNSGSAFRQWQKGVELARGEWIWIAESDDFCTNDLLGALVRQASVHENVVLSYCQSIEVNEEGEGHRDMRWFTDQASNEHWNSDYCNSGKSEIQNYLWQINSVPNASAVLFKKAAYKNVNADFLSMKMCGDWLLWIEIAKQGNVAFCAQPHNFFRKHSATTRTLETISKRRLLAEEEYWIAQVVQVHLKPSQLQRLQMKTSRILRNYSSTFAVKEVTDYLLHPRRYNKPIPYLRFMTIFFAGSLYRSTKKFLSGFLL